MVPAWMVPPLPLTPHNKLPAFPKGGRRRGGKGRVGKGKGVGSREQRRGQKRQESVAEHPHRRPLELGVRSGEGAGGGSGQRAGGRAAASALLSFDALLLHAPGVCECERACVSGRGRGRRRRRRRRHPGCSRGPASLRVRLGLTGARGGRWLARAPPSPPIPGACPNFLIQGTCRRRSCALPTVITVPSRQPPTEHAAAAVSADATLAATATASPLTGRAAGGYLQFPGATSISLPPSPAPLREAAAFSSPSTMTASSLRSSPEADASSTHFLYSLQNCPELDVEDYHMNQRG
uniref:uncharacterized protein LOC103793026 n=1 Tax=Callithrix jacchus TaxID=9483 RepID=UPI0023DD5473|nr:uncharacterized protein LOC103793026 [Callithrix jacchus]